MRRINLFQMGCGTIGRELIAQIRRSVLSSTNLDGIDLRWSCIADSQKMAFFPEGKPARNLEFSGEVLLGVQDSLWHQGGGRERLDFCLELADQVDGVSILVDLSASSKMNPFYEEFLASNHGVASANKLPFSTSLESFKRLVPKSRPLETALRFEATVGAGLPIIHAVLSLIEAGDQLAGIEGCFSGTLGTLFSGLTSDQLFSDLLQSAWRAGFTEPDPRDDLSGMDVARKVLILARLMGQDIEMDQVKVQNLVPENLREVPLSDFEARLHEMDAFIQKEFQEARAQQKVLRYCGSTLNTQVETGLRREDLDSPLGSLQGTDNLCVVNTKRYEQPLVIRGPGAGPAVTAAGVFHDILESSRILN
jgi:homoserine dehydrogenase